MRESSHAAAHPPLRQNPSESTTIAAMRGRWTHFAAIAAQFAVIVALVTYFRLETSTFAKLLQLAFVGFLVHHFLPTRYRLPFFALLSVGSVYFVLIPWGGIFKGGDGLWNAFVGVAQGTILVGVGLTLIGLCHLPVRMSVRIGLVALVGLGVSLLRAHSDWLPQLGSIWIILGSMFVFRLMIYIYDLKHRSAPFSPARAVAYFFMLPNVCFPLYPVVDYKTFCSTYYNEDWLRIYQSGVQWLLRGIFHLLLYRLVYQFAPFNVLTSATDVLAFVVGTYLLYLRISGQFHLIVGLLHLFGFNLPETHHLYLLASSFTDFWRRINIYWKDFIMKLFFYPAFFKLRKLGSTWALSLATLFAFFFTWLLHSWQWFWIRGSFLFTWQDISFWTILALLVLANAIYESKTVRRRSLNRSAITLGQRFTVGLKTIGTFIVISLLWTMWSCQSYEELQLLADISSKATLPDIAILLALLVGIGVAGMIWGQSSRDTSEGRPTTANRAPFLFWRSVTSVGVGSACLVALPLLSSLNLPGAQKVAVAMRSDKANDRDAELQQRGYYEELEQQRAGQQAWPANGFPKDWYKGQFYHNRADFLLNDFLPNSSAIAAGELATTDSLGLRDREYALAKPPGVYRIVLSGASHEAGTGVKDLESFENLVEDRLNAEFAGSFGKRFEILNLSVGNTGLFQKVARLEMKGFDLQPDMALITVYAPEKVFIFPKLIRALKSGFEPPPGFREYLADLYAKADIHPDTPNLVILSRLRPHLHDMYAWLVNRFKTECKQRGIRPLVIYRPQPDEALHPEEFVQLEESVRENDLGFLDLSGAFDSVADRQSLVLAPWDSHTNTRGHQLLADALYQRLLPVLLEIAQEQTSAPKTQVAEASAP